MAIFPSAVATDSELYIAVNNIVTELSSGIDDTTLTIPVNSTAGFPNVGCITIGAEIIKYTSKTASQFNASARGFDGTTAASHSSGDEVHQYIIADHHNVLKDEIKAVEQFLWDLTGASSTQFRAPVGSVSAPSYAFAGDPDTGIYWNTDNNFSFATAGGNKLQIGGTAIYPLVKVLNIDGSDTAPSYSFDADSNTGIYRSGTDQIGFTCGGTLRSKITSGVSYFYGDLDLVRSDYAGELNLLVLNNNASSAAYATIVSHHNNGTYGANMTMYTNVDAGNNRNMELWMTGAPVLEGDAQGGVNELLLKINVWNSGKVTAMNIPKTGEVQFSVGSVSLPSISFQGDVDTGIYRVTENNMAFVTAGAAKFQVGGTANYPLVKLLNIDGTALAPSYSFDSDSDTGIFSGGTNILQISTGGTSRLYVSNGSVQVQNAPLYTTDGTVTGPGYAFTNDIDTGLFLGSSGGAYLGLAVGGALQFYAQTGLVMNTGTLKNMDGSVGSPSYTFWTDTDTGIYRSSENNMVLVTAGGGKFQIGGTANYPLVKLLNIDGTSGAPSYSFDADDNTGMFRAAADRIGFSAGGTEYLTVGNTGAAGAIHSGAVGGFSNVINSAGNAAIFYATNNDNTNGTSHAIFATKTGGASSGDPKVTFEVSAITGWSMGIDNSDADIFCIDDSATSLVASSSAFALNTSSMQIIGQDGTLANPYYSFYNDRDTGIVRGASNSLAFVVGSGGDFNMYVNSVQQYNFATSAFIPVGSGAGTINLGTATWYWNDVSYKTITDRGCLPWCDDGVELADGSRVSDLEAIARIEKHPTEITIQGLPKLNYKTFPKKAYKPADKDGKIIPRDENDLPIEGADGVEMTMMFGVFIGAFKELKARIEALENKEK